MIAIFLLLGLSVIGADRSINIRNIPIYDINEVGGRVKRDVELLPFNLVFDVETDSDRGVLRLSQIDRLPTFSISNGVTEEIVGTRRNRAVYTDLSRKASVIVEMSGVDLEDNIVYKLLFVFTYWVSLISSPGHFVRFRETLIQNSAESGNFELEERMVYIKPVEDDDVNSGQAVQHVIHFEELMIDNGGDYHDRERNKRSTRFRKYIIEVCFISDAKDFEYYLERNNNNRDEAIDEMSVYYALVNEQLRLRYHSVYDTNGSIDILIKATGLFLLEDRLDSNFTAGLAKANDTQVESGDGLSACGDWLTDIPSNITLPTSDHYMFFTGYDLVQGNQTFFAGRAGLKAMCTPNSVSINENSRNGVVGSIIAHELGHGIGSRHDRQIGCNDEDGYIMSTSIALASNTEEALRLWQFSNCSVAIFKEALDEADCVYNDDREDELTTLYKGGEYYNTTQQCQLAFGKNYSYCDFYGKQPYAECYIMYCTDVPGSSCSSTFPQEHTQCGEESWCHKGACIPKSNVPPFISNLPASLDLTGGASGDIYTVQAQDDDGDEILYKIYWSPPDAELYFRFDNVSGVVSAIDCLPEAEVPNDTLSTTYIQLAVAVTDTYYTSYPKVLAWNVSENFKVTVCTEETDLLWLVPYIVGALAFLILLILLIVCCLYWRRKRRKKRAILQATKGTGETASSNYYYKDETVKETIYTTGTVGIYSSYVHHSSALPNDYAYSNNSKGSYANAPNGVMMDAGQLNGYGQSAKRGYGHTVKRPGRSPLHTKPVATPTMDQTSTFDQGPMVPSPTIRGLSRPTKSVRVQNILSGNTPTKHVSPVKAEGRINHGFNNDYLQSGDKLNVTSPESRSKYVGGKSPTPLDARIQNLYSSNARPDLQSKLRSNSPGIARRGLDFSQSPSNSPISPRRNQVSGNPQTLNSPSLLRRHIAVGDRPASPSLSGQDFGDANHDETYRPFLNPSTLSRLDSPSVTRRNLQTPPSGSSTFKSGHNLENDETNNENNFLRPPSASRPRRVSVIGPDMDMQSLHDSQSGSDTDPEEDFRDSSTPHQDDSPLANSGENVENPGSSELTRNNVAHIKPYFSHGPFKTPLSTRPEVSSKPQGRTQPQSSSREDVESNSNKPPKYIGTPVPGFTMRTTSPRVQHLLESNDKRRKGK